MTSATDTISASTCAARLPLGGLLALAMAAFITLLTEILPSGLLPQMAGSLGQSEALIGQLVTAYAVGSLVSAIPLTIATQSWRRRTLLLLLAIGGFAVVNTVTAISESYAITLVARFVAGMSAGLLWALAAGYAARMVPDHLQGRAIAIAMVGAPLALSLGIPDRNLPRHAVGLALDLRRDERADRAARRLGAGERARFPRPEAGAGVRAEGGVHAAGRADPCCSWSSPMCSPTTTLYTYIAPFLEPAGLKDRTDVVLLVFGLASLLGIWITGALIDRWLRELVLASVALFGLSAVALGIAGTVPAVIYGAVAIWGLAFGGVGTLFQTASAKAAGHAADVAQSMLVTTWNLAIAGGGILGGLLLSGFGVAPFPWVLAALLAADIRGRMGCEEPWLPGCQSRLVLLPTRGLRVSGSRRIRVAFKHVGGRSPAAALRHHGKAFLAAGEREALRLALEAQGQALALAQHRLQRRRQRRRRLEMIAHLVADQLHADVGLPAARRELGGGGRHCPSCPP